jgi:hypothetical protein
MQSKRVKVRIASNKQKRKVPMWKHQMRAFFISQLPPSQSVLSSKHFVVKVTAVGEKVLTEEYQSQRADEIFHKMATWTRHDWNAFIRSGDADYGRYIGYRGLYHSMVASRLAAKQLLTTPTPIGERLSERRKLIRGLTQGQINKGYGLPKIELPSCECGEMVGAHNVGLVCATCNTEVKVTSPILQMQQIDRAKRVVVLPADLEQLEKDFEGDEINMDLVIDARNPTLDIFGREDDYKKSPDLEEHAELVTKLIARHQKLYGKTPTEAEAAAEVNRLGHENVKRILREEQLRDEERQRGDDSTFTRMPGLDYHPKVIDADLAERNATPFEQQQIDLIKKHLDSPGVEWISLIPKKEGE